MYNFAPLAGKFGLADMFAGILKLLVMLCMRACVSDASVGLSSISGSPIRGSVPLAGESGITDVFSGVLEPFVSPCTFLYMFSMFTWLFSTLCVRVHVFGVSDWLSSLFGSPCVRFCASSW